MASDLADALRREMREEFGIDIEVGELLDVVDHILPERRPALGLAHLSSAAWSPARPRIREPEKCSAIGWFLPEEVPCTLSLVSRENLAHYLKRQTA